jgi:hypothetical protein
LAEVQRHVDYHAHAAALAKFDAAMDAAHNVQHGAAHRSVRMREQVRFISCSLSLADKWKSDPAMIQSEL